MTNFIINEDVNTNYTFGLERYKILKAKLEQVDGKMEWDESMSLLKAASENDVPKDFITLLSIVYNINNLNVLVAIKLNYKTLYELSVLKPLQSYVLICPTFQANFLQPVYCCQYSSL